MVNARRKDFKAAEAVSRDGDPRTPVLTTVIKRTTFWIVQTLESVMRVPLRWKGMSLSHVRRRNLRLREACVTSLWVTLLVYERSKWITAAAQRQGSTTPSSPTRSRATSVPRPRLSLFRESACTIQIPRSSRLQRSSLHQRFVLYRRPNWLQRPRWHHAGYISHQCRPAVRYSGFKKCSGGVQTRRTSIAIAGFGR